MIFIELAAINVVRVTGMDTDTSGPVVWQRALNLLARELQTNIYGMYRRERNAQGQSFYANSAKWNARKRRKGWAPERGQQLRRIVNTLRREPMWTISQIVNGQAFITFDERRLIARWEHAYYYAVKKVPGNRILQLDAAWLTYRSRGVQALHATDSAVSRDAVKRAEAAPRQIEQPVPQRMQATLQYGAGPQMTVPAQRRRMTLAQTAWRAAMDTTNKLRRL